MSLSDSTVEKYGGVEGGEGSNREFDFNSYATKKTIAKGLLDVGLLSSNASQLKTVVGLGSSHQYYTTNIALIVISILLQVVVGVLLLLIGCNKGERLEDKKRANVLNNVAVGVVAIITAINIFITAFVTQAN